MATSAAKAIPINRPKPLGTLIDDIWALRESKRNLETQVKDIEASIAESEAALMERLDAEGVDKSTGKKASVSISKSVVATIVDWDTFTAYVAKKKYFHLLQRRVSDTAARELFEQQGQVPGLEPFTKRKVNIRTLT